MLDERIEVGADAAAALESHLLEVGEARQPSYELRSRSRSRRRSRRRRQETGSVCDERADGRKGWTDAEGQKERAHARQTRPTTRLLWHGTYYGTHLGGEEDAAQ